MNVIKVIVYGKSIEEANSFMIFTDNGGAYTVSNQVGACYREQAIDFIANGGECEYIDIIFDKNKKNAIKSRQSYLQETDWYFVRFIDTQKEIPENIKQERAKAREELNLIEPCNTQEELDQIIGNV